MQFTEPPLLDLKDVFAVSKPETPLIFVLSPGVDPSPLLSQLAQDVGQRVEQLALGQGQTSIAEQVLEQGAQTGHWVFLANCHLSIAWMPKLEKTVRLPRALEASRLIHCALQIEQYATEGKLHPDFRLWLSSDPNPKFPITLLQNAVRRRHPVRVRGASDPVMCRLR